MKKPLPVAMACFMVLAFTACQKKFDGDELNGTGNTSTAKVIFKFKFDPTQLRLNNIGQPAVMPTGHAGLDPVMNGMSAHYLELAPGALTPLGDGAVLYKAEETTAGGANAIDFSKARIAGDGQAFLTIPIKDIPKGEYQYLRVSLAYQHFDVQMHIDTVFATPNGNLPYSGDLPCTVAGFIGFNTYIGSFRLKNTSLTVNDNRKQGFWGFECNAFLFEHNYTFTANGQSPEGATTVVNPINATSPVPPGSCVVTGAFSNGRRLTITGKETADIVVTVSLSVNKSFEWIDTNGNGKWDATKGEAVVDMGIRGMIPSFQ